MLLFEADSKKSMYRPTFITPSVLTTGINGYPLVTLPILFEFNLFTDKFELTVPDAVVKFVVVKLDDFIVLPSIVELVSFPSVVKVIFPFDIIVLINHLHSHLMP